MIENSTPRSSPPLEAAAPALAVVTRLPPNPHKISRAISGDSPRDRAYPVPRCSSHRPSSLRRFNFIYFILLYTFYSHLALLSVQPFWRHLSEATVTSWRGFQRLAARATPRCGPPSPPARTAVHFSEPGQRPERLPPHHPLGAALLAPSRPRGGFSGHSGTGHGSVRLLYRR